MNEYKLSGTGRSSIALKICVFMASLTIVMPGNAAFAAGDSSSQSFQDKLKGDWGRVMIDLRYRYARVERDGLKPTSGDPLRLRLAYLTPERAGFQALAEFEGSTPLFADDYNDKTNDKTEFAVIADPQAAEINRAWLSYAGIPDTVVKGGRQRINLDNQRFVGSVAWRQMEQTFDAVNLINTSIGSFSADAAYIWNVRDILSQNVDMQSPLLNLNYAFKNIGSLSGYGYWLDYDDPEKSGFPADAFSTQTFGLRFDGSSGVTDNLNLLYTAEYARQSDYQDNPETYTSDYQSFTLGLVAPNNNSTVTKIGGKLGYEVLGSDNGVSLKTPLGTNHLFNGWADQFLVAPPDGVRDAYVSVSGTWAGVRGELTYHDFRADAGDSKYGTEIDAALTKKIGSNYEVQAVYAQYNADEYNSDVKKFWLQFTVVY